MTIEDFRFNFKPEYGYIPQDVLKRISEEVNRINYDFVFVFAKSLHTDDKDLYVVIAQKKDKEEYAFWSCYNDSRQTLNHGHYGYEELCKCFEDALEFVN